MPARVMQTPKKLEFRLTIVIEPDADGFHAYCPALKGLHTCGETEQETLENAKHAAIAYLRSLIKHGDPIPVGIAMQPKPKLSWCAAFYSKRQTFTENLVLATT